MGALLQPTPEMDPYAVEVRRESAYLSGSMGDYNAWREGEQPDPPRRTIYGSKGEGFAVLADDIPSVLAAFEQIAEHPAYTDWCRSPHATEILNANLNWRTEQRDDIVRAYGPAIIYGDHPAWSPVGTVELRYEDVAALRVELAVVHYELTGRAWDAPEGSHP
jgi:hypothetical protein